MEDAKKPSALDRLANLGVKLPSEDAKKPSAMDRLSGLGVKLPASGGGPGLVGGSRVVAPAGELQKTPESEKLKASESKTAKKEEQSPANANKLAQVQAELCEQVKKSDEATEIVLRLREALEAQEGANKKLQQTNEELQEKLEQKEKEQKEKKEHHHHHHHREKEAEDGEGKNKKDKKHKKTERDESEETTEAQLQAAQESRKQVLKDLEDTIKQVEQLKAKIEELEGSSTRRLAEDESLKSELERLRSGEKDHVLRHAENKNRIAELENELSQTRSKPREEEELPKKNEAEKKQMQKMSEERVADVERQLEATRMSETYFKGESEKFCERAKELEGAIQALKTQLDRGTDDQESSSSGTGGRIPADTLRSKRFKPRVAVYDVSDEQKGLRRVVRVEAPGRYLGDDSSTVEGAVKAIPGGVSIRLSKSADVAAGAVFCTPWIMDDAVGTWDWDYTPSDGAWELCDSWGFSHGVFAFSLREASRSQQTKALASSAPAPVTLVKSCWTRASMMQASTTSSPTSTDTATSCIAVIAPVSTHKRSRFFFRAETVFVGAYGNRIEADNVIPGILLLGPQGAVEVAQVSWEMEKYREIASMSMGSEVLSVLVGTKVASVALTEDGAAAADWAYHDVRGLQAGSHEVGICSPGGVETTAPLHSMGLLGQQTAALALEIEFGVKDRGVFIVVDKSIVGHMNRSKKDAVQNQSPKRVFKSRGPFENKNCHYTSPEQRRMIAKGASWR